MPEEGQVPSPPPDPSGGSPAPPSRRANRLIGESSPYLLQHAYNPVDWYPWGPEALERSKRENKPIFLSIGYAACHWCHVMAHESFESEGIARLLNERFVCIKVDREERPDLDEIYMAAVQLIAGQGGWPMSVFLTPDLEPFFAGTYFPPDDRYGRPGFARIVEGLSHAFESDRERVETGAAQVTERLRMLSVLPEAGGEPGATILDDAARGLARIFDAADGGFGSAPKFPHTLGAQLLLRRYERTGDAHLLEMTVFTLERMAEGGIYDHLGGGFHRYSTDARWLVPHFEKMLYDQALLVLAYLETFQVTGRPLFAAVVRETLDYVLRDLTSPDGAFYSSEDADSEGVEGKFFVWTPEEIRAAAGERDGDLFCRAYGVEPGGNFEGKSILHRVRGAADLAIERSMEEAEVERILASVRETLLAIRAKRVRPGRDEKILAGWNGLMITAFARASRVLGEASYRDAARRAARFALDRMRPGGVLHRVHKDGRTTVPGYLEDHANLIGALIDLYEATFEIRWLEEAERLADAMIGEFADREGGGFFLSGDRHDGLLLRIKMSQDGSVPSGNSMAAYVLLRLGRLLGRDDLEKLAAGTLRSFGRHLEQIPGALHQMLLALDLLLGPRREIVLAGEPDEAGFRSLRRVVDERFLPRAVLAAAVPTRGGEPGSAGERRADAAGDPEPGEPGQSRKPGESGESGRSGESGESRGHAGASGRSLPLLDAKTTVEGRAAAYVCENYACDRPVTDPEELNQRLAGEG